MCVGEAPCDWIKNKNVSTISRADWVRFIEPAMWLLALLRPATSRKGNTVHDSSAKFMKNAGYKR